MHHSTPRTQTSELPLTRSVRERRLIKQRPRIDAAVGLEMLTHTLTHTRREKKKKKVLSLYRRLSGSNLNLVL